MIRKYHRLVGTLTAGLMADSTVATIDWVSANAIAVDFQNGQDYAYFALYTGGAYEVIRVYGIAGNVISIVRGQDGTLPQVFPIGATFAYVVTAEGVLGEFLELGGGAGSSNVSILGQGIATVVQNAPNDYTVAVLGPTFNGINGVEVTGAWPNFQISTANDGDCCAGNGSTTTGGVGGLTLHASGILSGYYSAGDLYLGVPSPIFSGTGINITGQWPNINFALAGAVGSGTVSSVNVGAGLTLTGSPNVNPTVSITNTGVVAGDYGDVHVNARGQIEYVAPTFNPISAVVSADGSIIVTRTGGTITIDMQQADIGVVGAVALADHTEDFNPTDHVHAATPAVVAKALSTFAIPEVNGASNHTSEADGDYTAAIGSSASTVVLTSGEKALVLAEVMMVNLASPATPVEFGMAIFDATPAKLRGNRKIAQSQQSMNFLLVGPINAAISIVTTAVPSGAAVTGYSLNVIKF